MSAGAYYDYIDAVAQYLAPTLARLNYDVYADVAPIDALLGKICVIRAGRGQGAIGASDLAGVWQPRVTLLIAPYAAADMLELMDDMERAELPPFRARHLGAPTTVWDPQVKAVSGLVDYELTIRRRR